MSYWWLPENIAIGRDDVDFLFIVILVLTGIVFFLVQGVLIYFIYRYRQQEGQKAV